MTINNVQTFLKAVRTGYIDGVQVYSAYLYKDKMTNQDRYAIFINERYDDMYVTPYATDIVCMRCDGLTTHGAEFLFECVVDNG